MSSITSRDQTRTWKRKPSNTGSARYGAKRRGHKEKGMSDYDRLPPEVRNVLANLNLEWSSTSALRFVQLGLPIPWIIENMRKADAEAVEKMRQNPEKRRAGR